MNPGIHVVHGFFTGAGSDGSQELMLASLKKHSVNLRSASNTRAISLKGPSPPSAEATESHVLFSRLDLRFFMSGRIEARNAISVSVRLDLLTMTAVLVCLVTTECGI